MGRVEWKSSRPMRHVEQVGASSGVDLLPEHKKITDINEKKICVYTYLYIYMSIFSMLMVSPSNRRGMIEHNNVCKLTFSRGSLLFNLPSARRVVCSEKCLFLV